MTVYVDDAAIPTGVGESRVLWFHVFADTRVELADYAARLGLAHDCGTRYHPSRQCPVPWLFITEPQRVRAILTDAVPVPVTVTARVISRQVRPPARSRVELGEVA
jgi:hypothetical protein